MDGAGRAAGHGLELSAILRWQSCSPANSPLCDCSPPIFLYVLGCSRGNVGLRKGAQQISGKCVLVTCCYEAELTHTSYLSLFGSGIRARNLVLCLMTHRLHQGDRQGGISPGVFTGEGIPSLPPPVAVGGMSSWRL